MVSRISTPRGRRLVPVILAMVLAMTAGTAIGGHFATAVKSYTGCLNAGTIVQVAEGTAPAKRCANNQVEVHFSGGDITAITAGTGLVGGADNGAAALAIAPAYQLPQACATAQVAKWNGTGWACAADDSAAYTAGTGLDLNGTEFSLDDDYQLPQDCDRGEAVARVPGLSAGLDQWGCRQYAQASETCPSGEFARATNTDGELVCAAPGSGAAAELDIREFVQVDFNAGVGIPDDGTYRPYLSGTVPAGTWMFVAKGTVTRSGESEGCGPGFCAAGDPPSGHAICTISLDGSELDRADVRVYEDEMYAYFPFALTSWETTSGGTVSVTCAALDADAVGVRNLRIVALRIGS